MAKNRVTLRDLTISLESFLIDNIVYSDRFNSREHIVTSFRFCKRLSEYADPTDYSIPVLNLEKLKIKGLDLRILPNFAFQPLTDLAGLKSLTFESCCGLSDALRQMAWKFGDTIINNLPNLSSLTVRHEQEQSEGPQSAWSLRHFLCNLTPLKTLRVLLSGREYYFGNLRDILKVHGATLQTLVWDERQCQRLTLDNNPLVIRSDAGRLPVIVEFCPNLIELGIPIRWDDGPDVPVEGHKVHVRILRPYATML